MNQTRQDEDRRTLDEAFRQLEATYDPERDYGVVLAAEGWHPGVIGIVASRVVERIHRPVVLVALDGRAVAAARVRCPASTCTRPWRRAGSTWTALAGIGRPRAWTCSGSGSRSSGGVQRPGPGAAPPDDLRPHLRPDLALSFRRRSRPDPLAGVPRAARHRESRPPLPGRRAPRGESPGGRAGSLEVTSWSGSARPDAIGFGLVDRHPPDQVSAAPRDALYRLTATSIREG